MDPTFIAAIFLFAGNFNPVNFQLCSGQLIAISQNDTLYTLLGTTYGGDGVNTFGLPDLRGRVPISQGPNYFMGQMAGNENVTLTPAQIPAHTHNINVSSANASTQTPVSTSYLASVVVNNTALNAYSTATPTGTMASSSVGVSTGGQPFSIIQPVLAVNYIMAMFGVYPSQN
ncbi:MAG: hypothetical protein JWP44_3008 [Mucilaginibacter sp.]|nr:hypothetical protein [Mucilaginibacter sp.]